MRKTKEEQIDLHFIKLKTILSNIIINDLRLTPKEKNPLVSWDGLEKARAYQSNSIFDIPISANNTSANFDKERLHYYKQAFRDGKLLLELYFPNHNFNFEESLCLTNPPNLKEAIFNFKRMTDAILLFKNEKNQISSWISDLDNIKNSPGSAIISTPHETLDRAVEAEIFQAVQVILESIKKAIGATFDLRQAPDFITRFFRLYTDSNLEKYSFPPKLEPYKKMLDDFGNAIIKTWICSSQLGITTNQLSSLPIKLLLIRQQVRKLSNSQLIIPSIDKAFIVVTKQCTEHNLDPISVDEPPLQLEYALLKVNQTLNHATSVGSSYLVRTFKSKPQSILTNYLHTLIECIEIVLKKEDEIINHQELLLCFSAGLRKLRRYIHQHKTAAADATLDQAIEAHLKALNLKHDWEDKSDYGLFEAAQSSCPKLKAAAEPLVERSDPTITRNPQQRSLKPLSLSNLK